MFTGIVSGMGRVQSLDGDEVVRLVVDFTNVSTSNLEIGASVSVDGASSTEYPSLLKKLVFLSGQCNW